LPEFGKSTPLGRAGQPTELAPAYVFLTSTESSYGIGETLNVNGGTPTPRARPWARRRPMRAMSRPPSPGRHDPTSRRTAPDPPAGSPLRVRAAAGRPNAAHLRGRT